jgi:hypothetical protein
MSFTELLDRRTKSRRAPGDPAPLESKEPPAPSGPPPPWWGPVLDRLTQPEYLITLAVVAVCVIFTFVELQPSKIFANTTPSGGDMGAHVWLPAFLKQHLLGHLRVTGWTQDWYDGFPVLTYYFPLPMWAIAFLSYVIPYNIAFKLVSISGLVALPVCAWAFGRLSRMRFPGPACLAVASTGFLFSRDFTIYGGNIASTMAGEFSFAISLCLALLFLGLVARGLRTGRGRALAAVVLCCGALSHILPTAFAVGGAIVLTVMRLERRRYRWLLPVLVVGGALTAFWALPFEYRLPYATNMGYEKVTTYISSLFPAKDLWLFVLATTGIVLSLARRRRTGTFLSIMTVLCAIVFCIAPQARLWNARVLPFWFLLLYLLAGVALAEVGTLIVEAVTSDPMRTRPSLLAVPVVALIIALLWVGFPLRILPFGHVDSRTGKYQWLGISSGDNSFLPDWVRWNYSGYQSTTKARAAEYSALVKKMTALGRNPADGCGQADWEYEPELDQMGTPDALMLLPYWTKGCIGSMEGLYYESSATTPYHFLNASELSLHPADPERGLNYSKTTLVTPSGSSTPDVAGGVAHLQMLGVKYYMALTPETQVQADADPDLSLVASVGPYPVSYTSSGSTSVVQRTWKIYKVAGSAKVTPLTNQPVVMKGTSSGGDAWLKASESWYLDPSRSNVFEAASGPKAWTRVSPSDTSPPRTPLPPVTVSNVKVGEDTVNFNVDRTGVPVLVKVSYFPNWKVSGASGIYRVTPNLMVVVPTSKHVRLHYGYTPIDWLGFLITLAGIAGVVALIRLEPVRYALRRPSRAAAPPPEPEVVDATSAGLTVPYQRLGSALADALPAGSRGANGDLDLWLGHPGGLDLARYYATGWQGQSSPPAPAPIEPETPRPEEADPAE